MALKIVSRVVLVFGLLTSLQSLAGDKSSLKLILNEPIFNNSRTTSLSSISYDQFVSFFRYQTSATDSLVTDTMGKAVGIDEYISEQNIKIIFTSAAKESWLDPVHLSQLYSKTANSILKNPAYVYYKPPADVITELTGVSVQKVKAALDYVEFKVVDVYSGYYPNSVIEGSKISTKEMDFLYFAYLYSQISTSNMREVLFATLQNKLASVMSAYIAQAAIIATKSTAAVSPINNAKLKLRFETLISSTLEAANFDQDQAHKVQIANEFSGALDSILTSSPSIESYARYEIPQQVRSQLPHGTPTFDVFDGGMFEESIMRVVLPIWGVTAFLGIANAVPLSLYALGVTGEPTFLEMVTYGLPMIFSLVPYTICAAGATACITTVKSILERRKVRQKQKALDANTESQVQEYLQYRVELSRSLRCIGALDGQTGKSYKEYLGNPPPPKSKELRSPGGKPWPII